MEHEFWHAKWASNCIGFHLDDVNPLLTTHWHETHPNPDDAVLVPLCGKSEDLEWLAFKHRNVTGVELSDIAVRAFFSERFYTPTVTTINSYHSLYQFDELNIYVGDVFTVPLESVDIIYDRAALVALREDQRADYVSRLLSCLNLSGRILLITIEHQNERLGPPFSIDSENVAQLFAGCDVKEIAYQPATSDGNIDGERVWLIRKV